MNRTIRRSVLAVALAMALASTVAHAQSSDGSLQGRATAGAAVTVVNESTGFTRTVTANADGDYRFASLPPGTYKLSSGGGAPVDVRVSLGNATTIDLLGEATLAAVEVLGAYSTPVDVTSTESATNITRDEYTRLPVDRDLQSIAGLAPGIGSGDNDLGGLSFGGSSVAENSVYINGLNVSDFYNRISFNEAPFAFYDEVQVKTGGYSVEFGRTTGGVINAISRSGTNEFHAGAELVYQPDDWASEPKDRFDPQGNRYIVSQYDLNDETSLNVWASGPIVQDRLHFFAMYEGREIGRTNTNDPGTRLNDRSRDDGFWGAKFDWSITDRHLLEFFAFSNEDTEENVIYGFDPDTGDRDARQNTVFTKSGGDNWALTYTGYLTDSFTMRALYGEVERNRGTNSELDIACNRVFDNRPAPLRGDKGCTTSALIEDAVDTREAARLDFEWVLGDHQLRFGLDHETNTSDYFRFYPGPDRLRYDVFAVGASGGRVNGVVLPANQAYVRTRQLEVDGEFETINEALYLEDNWQVTDNLLLNLGIRREGFDNKNGEGDTYIKIDDMWAPRFGFSWDMRGDGRSKVFGNLGRYYLPVANVINIKQGGGFLDERTFYLFNGYETREENGITYRFPILGAQFGPVDNSQGDGTVGDLRGEVDADMDPVYQDEAILGYQSMMDDKWSWGVRGTYRRLKNAIDDMNITSNGILCDGVPGEVGFVMANPGRTLTVYTDTDCDGENDAFVDIDTSVAGWARFDDDGNFLGENGWEEPKRTYKAIELVLDRAWDDKWAFNASYTWSRSEGNAEGPVTSDFNFGDSGRTEAFDDPWVNYDAFGYLPNDRRHAIKARGVYALSDHWQVGGTLNVQSGRAISALGVGNPFDANDFHSFFICVDNCDAPDPTDRVYEFRGRGNEGRTPWTYDVGASVTYLHSFGNSDLRVKLAVFNLFNQQRTIEVEEELQETIGESTNPDYKLPLGFQTPRFAQLTVTLEF
jgi:hypothetical protein